MTTRSENSLTALKRSVEERMEADRMRDVLLLLEGLVNREETTAKIILDCLYDVGSVHLINQKASCRHLNGMMKFIARMSKPAFRFFALRWFKRTCPKLIADWLHSQVIFQKLSDQPSTDPFQDVTSQQSTTALTKVDNCSQEIQRLRFQVRWLTGALIGAIAALGGVVTLWLASGFVLEPSPRSNSLNRQRFMSSLKSIPIEGFMCFDHPPIPHPTPLSHALTEAYSTQMRIAIYPAPTPQLLSQPKDPIKNLLNRQVVDKIAKMVIGTILMEPRQCPTTSPLQALAVTAPSQKICR